MGVREAFFMVLPHACASCLCRTNIHLPDTAMYQANERLQGMKTCTVCCGDSPSGNGWRTPVCGPPVVALHSLRAGAAVTATALLVACTTIHDVHCVSPPFLQRFRGNYGLVARTNVLAKRSTMACACAFPSVSTHVGNVSPICSIV